MRTVSNEERRTRLVRRHHLVRDAADAVEAVRGVVASHSSDPATPYLSAWARIPDFQTEQLDHALYVERTLWRLHAMRRTMFVVASEEGPMFQAAAARDVATRERRKLEQWLAAEMPADHVPGFVDDLEGLTMTALVAGAASTPELSAAVPALRTEVTVGSGKWTARTPISSRLLFVLALDGRIVRTRPAGSWRSSQYGWATVASWFTDQLAEQQPVEAARAELVRRYLRAYGPATRDDLRWWTGWTAKQADAALDAVPAVKVRIEPEDQAFVLSDDSDEIPPAPPSVALLPALDPSPMGWKARHWYVGNHAPQVFDRNANVGPTVWVDGRIVGGWAQRPGGEVVYRLLDDVGAEAAARVEAEAAALTAWLAGTVVTPRFRTPLERELSG